MRFIIGMMIVLFGLSLMTFVIYKWFESREMTKRQKLKQEHERTMEELDRVFDDDER